MHVVASVCARGSRLGHGLGLVVLQRRETLCFAFDIGGQLVSTQSRLLLAAFRAVDAGPLQDFWHCELAAAGRCVVAQTLF